MAAERVLVNFFYAQPVGHAVEALHYCLGHHVADPTREIAVALNAASAVELAGLCPFVAETYAIEHPLLEPSDRHLTATRRRTIVGMNPPGYVPHQQLRLALPQHARASAAKRFAEHENTNGGGGPDRADAGRLGRALAVPVTRFVAGDPRRARRRLPGLQIALVGKRTRDGRTATSAAPPEHEPRAHRRRPRPHRRRSR
jgi:hypothetical protein